jgi:hypothetical protein
MGTGPAMLLLQLARPRLRTRVLLTHDRLDFLV